LLKTAVKAADKESLSEVEEVRSRAVVRPVPLFRAECPDCGWASLTTSDTELARMMAGRHDVACQRAAAERAAQPVEVRSPRFTDR